jgi:hypothetical protein
MFPVGLIMAAGTLFCFVLFAAISRAYPPACELHARIAWAFAASAATAGICLPVTFVEGNRATTLLATVCGVAGLALAWWATGLLFPRFC